MPYSSKSLKGIKQKINFELKNIVHWLRANEIPLNNEKTEIVLFRTQKTIINKNMSFRISGQKINIMKNIMKSHMNTVKLKLNRANDLLTKLRNFINPILPESIYYVLSIIDANANSILAKY